MNHYISAISKLLYISVKHWNCALGGFQVRHFHLIIAMCELCVLATCNSTKMLPLLLLALYFIVFIYNSQYFTYNSCIYRVGGSLPVIFSYFTEFFSKKKRGPFIIMLSMFWTIGQVYTALLAWLVIPRGCIKFNLFGVEFHNWRVFAMLCTIPSLSSALFLFLMPESPSFLLLVS